MYDFVNNVVYITTSLSGQYVAAENLFMQGSLWEQIQKSLL